MFMHAWENEFILIYERKSARKISISLFTIFSFYECLIFAWQKITMLSVANFVNRLQKLINHSVKLFAKFNYLGVHKSKNAFKKKGKRS